MEIADGLSVMTGCDLRVGGVSEPRTPAGKLRYPAGLEVEWIVFEQRLASSTESAPDSLLRVVEFAQITERDPLLPLELRPPDWPGGRARATMAAAIDVTDSSDIPLTRAVHGLLAQARWSAALASRRACRAAPGIGVARNVRFRYVRYVNEHRVVALGGAGAMGRPAVEA
ncbi:PaaX family transcriptional regulator C-terminal domain-containing protein, partial [Streptosporangium canum]|uniref:PaaX family transcriptional regulator C-terminal domain-containing protein n=1 Tax=Streptosporangium canum TaxID=324952 RepID=UPI003425C984